MKFRQAIVVGGSSGIGEEIVLQLAEKGCRVAVLARRADRLENVASKYPDLILPFEWDVDRTAGVEDAFLKVTQELGGLDLFVYVAGIMPEVAADEFDTAKDLAMVQTNLSGAIAWINESAKRFQAAKTGSIVAIGSVAGDRGRSGRPVYCATKAALATYVEALRNRLDRQGVVVATMKPGPVQTDLIKGLDFKNALTAKEAARRILDRAGLPGEHYLEFSHRIIFTLIKLVPSWLFRRIGPP